MFLFMPDLSTICLLFFSHFKVIYIFGFQLKRLLERVNEYATLRAW